MSESLEDTGTGHSHDETPAPAGGEAMAGELTPAAGHFAWETYVRCFFLVVMMFVVGVLAWRPGALRLTMLMSFATPSQSGNLAWRPVDDTPAAPAPVKRVAPPAEWRLGPTYAVTAAVNRPAAKSVPPNSRKLPVAAWRRSTDNPWNWQHDVPPVARDTDDALLAMPPQKPPTSVRVGDIPFWPAPAAMPAATVQPTPTLSAPALSGDFLPPLPALGGVGQTALPAASATGQRQTGPSATAGLNLPELPPALLPMTESTAGGTAPAPQTASRAPAPAAPQASRTQSQPPAAPQPATETIDWKTREITGPIKDAYLMVYPRLKFIGLCVPGQGYIRKYNQVGVPNDVSNPKMSARDGRAPYGRYYIADRHRDADGPRLYLSWPSPDDAVRIGLDPAKRVEIDNAWRRQALPPQDTAAGGGVGITGLRNWVEFTEGGFTLEAPHMEEIYTALPDKAWVLIQP